jgi:hypothetical protein
VAEREVVLGGEGRGQPVRLEQRASTA